MISKLKKLTMLVAMAATLGLSVTATSTTGASAMPRGPVAKADASVELVRHRGHRRMRRHRRHWRHHRHGRWHRYPFYVGRWGWRHCHRYLRRYRYTGNRYWLYRYRRCIRYRYW